MKRSFTFASLWVLLIAFSSAPVAAQDWGRLLEGGMELVQSFTISDSQVKQYVSQFVASSDSKNQVAAADSPYTTRLKRITSGIASVDGQPLNFKVYMTKEINAFACADGSVRVYSGLMDAMTDDEVLGVIGHEIGHVAHKDTKNAMKSALRTSALRHGISSAGGMVATLSDSMLGDLGEAILNAKYSQKQESNADDYAYSFLKKAGRNPLALAAAFTKLQSLESSSSSNLVQSLFSSHPDTAKRIKNIENKAKKDGYSYATLNTSTQSSATTANGGSTAVKNSTSGTSSSASSSQSKTSETSKKSSFKNKKR